MSNKKLFKKIAAAFLAAMVTIIFTACNGGGLESSSTPNNASNSTEASGTTESSSSGETTNPSAIEVSTLYSDESSSSPLSPDYPNSAELSTVLSFAQNNYAATDESKDIGTANNSQALYANVPDLTVDYSKATTTVTNASQLTSALSAARAGDVIIIKEGTYNLSSTIALTQSGTRKSYITIAAESGKRAILNFSSQSIASSSRGISLSGSYWHLYGIDIKAAGDNGILVGGHYNIIENCQFYDNWDSGLQISRTSSQDQPSFSTWPHDNLVKNCTSFNNSDASGENADGFASKLTCGNNNTFDHCIAYSNSDDGWDLYANTTPIGRVILYNCVSFSNGKLLDGTHTQEGDYNGYKLGSNNYNGNHYVENCVAFDNYNHGITCNGNPGQLTVKNCTSYNNSLLNGTKTNMCFDKNTDGPTKVLSNLLSISSGSSSNDKYYGIVKSSLLYFGGYYLINSTSAIKSENYKSNGTKKTITPSQEFASLSSPTPSTTIHTTMRNADGTINLGSFLKLNDSSTLQAMGENGERLGANLNRTSYYSVEEVIAFISSIGSTANTQASFYKISTAAKGYASLSENDRTKVTNFETLYQAVVDFKTKAGY